MLEQPYYGKVKKYFSYRLKYYVHIHVSKVLVGEELHLNAYVMLKVSKAS